MTTTTMKRKDKAAAQLLNAISTTSPRFRKKLLQNLPDDTIKAICEALYNVLHGNRHPTAKELPIFHKYKRTIRQLGNKPFRPLKEKRVIIAQQSGGFIGTLLPIIAAILLENV